MALWGFGARLSRVLLTPLDRLRDADPVTARLEHVAWDDGSAERIASAAARGQVVFVLRQRSLVDLLALAHLVRRTPPSVGLAPLGFSSELGLALGSGASDGTPEGLSRALARGASAVLFLRRPPEPLASRAAGRTGGEGDRLLEALLERQRVTTLLGDGPELLLVPLTFVWSARPDRLRQRRLSTLDALVGITDLPAELRAATQLLLDTKRCAVRAGEPLALRAFLEAHEGASPAQVGARLRYSLVRRVERERRAVLGPTEQPTERVLEAVMKSEKLARVIRDLAGRGPTAPLEARARAMLRALAARPDPTALGVLESLADLLARHVFQAIEVDEEGMARMREAARHGTLVLLPSHKSHVDYLLLSWVLRKHSLSVPIVAAGDNLSFFPVGPLFRRSGAFFIRRDFKGDRLYVAVVDAYVRKLLRDGHAIELFLEGGRSRSGKLLAPMLGLLNMVVDAALGAEGTRVFFVPISIAYERMMEDKAFARELLGHAKERESARSLVEVAGVLREQYGRVSVQVGELVELGELARELGVSPSASDGVPPARRRALVTRLAYRVMNEINRVTTVTPGALVATVLLSRGPRGLAHRELVGWALRLATRLAGEGVRLTPTLLPSAGEPSREAALVGALALYAKAGYLDVLEPGRFGLGDDPRAPEARVGEAAIYRAVEAQRVRLDYAKNVSVHVFVERALVATAFLGLARGGSLVSAERLASAVRGLSRLFKHELLFRSGVPFEEVLAQATVRMVADGTLARPYPDAFAEGPGSHGASGAEWLEQDAAIVRNFIEGYRAAARSLKALRKGPMTKKDLALRGLRLGQEMLLRGELERAEAVVRPTLENAYDAFLDEGYLEKREGKLALTPSFDDDDALATIEARVMWQAAE